MSFVNRGAIVAVAFLTVGLVVAASAAPSSAHPSPWSTVLVSTTSHSNTGTSTGTGTGTGVQVEAKIPIGEYELATGEDVPATAAGVAAAAAGLTRRISRDVSLNVNGNLDELAVESVTLGRVAGYPALVVELNADPVAGELTSLDLTWLLVAREVPNHKAYVTFDHDGTKKLVAVLTQAGPTTQLRGATSSSGTGGQETSNETGTETSAVSITSMISMGVHHIASGYDHLLFLTMLLLPAPLWARRRRTKAVSGANVRLRSGSRGLARTGKRVALVVTSFTVGHSLTLAAISFGLIHVPTRPIEVLVAASIVVAGAHAARPLLPGAEPVIAALFGLVHGGAFATTILELGLDRTDTLRAVLGFNLGIELAQLVVVACVVPLLYLASASRDYRYLVLSVATLGCVCAVDWIVAIMRDNNPVLQSGFDLLAEYPVLTWTGLAAICTSLYLTRAAAAPPQDGEPHDQMQPHAGNYDVPEDGVLGRALDMDYQATEEVDGLDTYRFAYSVKDAPIQIAEGLAGTYDNLVTVWVDPTTGAIVKSAQHQQRFLTDGTPVVDVDVTATAQTVAAKVAEAEDNARALRLMTTVVPVAGLASGAVALLAAILLLVLPRPRHARVRVADAVPDRAPARV